MNPLDFAALASHLALHVSEFPEELQEAVPHAAISRIYYGILHWMQFQYRIHVPPQKIQTYHAYVSEELERIANDDVLFECNLLKDKRVKADYVLEYIVGDRDLSECLESKERIIRLIEETPNISFDIEEDKDYYKKKKHRSSSDR